MGDFNVVLGSHVYWGRGSPVACVDFHEWIHSHKLIHLPTYGVFYTWNNGGKQPILTEKRLDI